MKRLFGTDGIRGVAGTFPLDEATVVRIGKALVNSLHAAAGGSPRLVIGRDTRESGPVLEAALARGIVAARGRVDLGGVLTTPRTTRTATTASRSSRAGGRSSPMIWRRRSRDSFSMDRERRALRTAARARRRRADSLPHPPPSRWAPPKSPSATWDGF